MPGTAIPRPHNRPRRPRASARRRTGALLPLALAAALVGGARAQDARSLGMGGVLVPGPGAAAANPAYAAVPGAGGLSLPLPLGALALLTTDDWDPSGPRFDALTALDRGANLDRYLLNPAVSPDVVDVRIDAGGLAIDLQGGSSLALGAPARVTGGMELSLGGRIGPVTLALRPYLTATGSVTPGADLLQVFRGGSTSASAIVRADAEAGVALDVGTALRLPIPLPDDGALYGGARVSAVLGLGRASAELTGEAAAEVDANGRLNGTVHTRYHGSYSVGSVLDGALGYGAEADLGVVVTTPTEAGAVTLGVALRHLGAMHWTLRETAVQGDDSGSTTTELGLVGRTEVARRASLGMNVALDLAPATLGVPGMGLLLAADGHYALDGGIGAHAGAEARFGPVAARAGVGYDGGLRLGLGAGVAAGPVAVDVALSARRSPFTTHQAYGVSASLGFGF